MSEHQCEVWQALIKVSIENLDDRQIRIKILQHPFTCTHKVCMEVAELWKTVTDRGSP